MTGVQEQLHERIAMLLRVLMSMSSFKFRQQIQHTSHVSVSDSTPKLWVCFTLFAKNTKKGGRNQTYNVNVPETKIVFFYM